MTDKNALFIEETTPEGYKILWRAPETASVDEAFNQALTQLKALPSPNRLELWSKAHADSPKGFAPMAFRPANSTKVLISHTLAMLGGLTKSC